MHNKEEKMEAFGRLLDILDELRVKCPWDRKQTHESLRPNTIEETYELCDALMRDDKNEICKELGDVLLHVIFYAKIGSEKGDYDIKEDDYKDLDRSVNIDEAIGDGACLMAHGNVLPTPGLISLLVLEIFCDFRPAVSRVKS